MLPPCGLEKLSTVLYSRLWLYCTRAHTGYSPTLNWDRREPPIVSTPVFKSSSKLVRSCGYVDGPFLIRRKEEDLSSTAVIHESPEEEPDKQRSGCTGEPPDDS